MGADAHQVPIQSFPSAGLDARTTTLVQGSALYLTGSSNQNSIHYGPSIIMHQQTGKAPKGIPSDHRSQNAEYDVLVENAIRGPCAPGTRRGVLRKLQKWCKSNKVPFYWLRGIAGTGKTTIAYSICQWLRKKKLLGASFFCSRMRPDCREIKLILPTIAHQLAAQFPSFRRALHDVVQNDPDIFRKDLASQLHALIIRPWKDRKFGMPAKTVVVLDALDECDEDHASFLRVLLANAEKLPFKILITSRPDHPIIETMRSRNPKILSTLILNEVEKSSVQSDIAKYLRYELSPRNVSPAVINELTKLSGELFIVAATLARLFKGGNIDSVARLSAFLKSPSLRLEVLSAVDDVYRGVLATAFRLQGEGHIKVLSEAEVQGIKEILFTVVCAYEPLTRETISQIWSIPPDEVDRRLDSLHSVLYVPEDRQRPIVILHTSFSDFIQDQARSGAFYCDSSLFNFRIATSCFELMVHQLHPNMCQVDEGRQNKTICHQVIKSRIKPGLAYASSYFVQHSMSALSNLANRMALRKMIHQFLTAPLLCWFECLSLLGRLWMSIQCLEKICNEFSEDPEEASLMSLADDALRLIQRHYDLVVNSAIMIYSAFPWIPSGSPFHSTEVEFYAYTPRALNGLPSGWTGPDRVIDVDTKLITSIAISQGTDRVAIGSIENSTHIWLMRSQEEECILTGHTDKVNAVAISEDGIVIVSGSMDGSVRLWDRASCRTTFPFGTSSSTLSVAISSDGESIASGHADSLIRIWDGVNHRRTCSLNGHEGCVRSIAFIPNSIFLVSGSDDKTACIWNLLSGMVEHVLRGHTWSVCSVACSLDGGKIITGSSDCSARIWNTSGKHLHLLERHTGPVHSVAFLPDSKRVVTGSKDGTVCLWDSDTGCPVYRFTGAGEVRSIATFPDGKRFASCAGNQVTIWSLKNGTSPGAERREDSTSAPVVEAGSMVFSSNGQKVLLLPSLRILDAVTLKEKAVLRSQDPELSCAALSVSGSKVAATTWIRIEVWDLADDGINYISLMGHCDDINSLSFSQDECLLVSASRDRTARVWDLTACNQTLTLQHAYSVIHASFSHDSTRLVSSSVFKTVHIWDAQSGHELHQFRVDAFSVTFTPDDSHIIASDDTDTYILNAHMYEQVHISKGCGFWTTLENGSSYALHKDGWVYHFARFGDQGHRVVWIPPAYRPPVNTAERSSIYRSSSVERLPFSAIGPLFTQMPEGIHLCLPRQDGLVTLFIPRNRSRLHSKGHNGPHLK